MPQAFSQQTPLSEAFGQLAALSSWKRETIGRYRRAIRFFEEYLGRVAVLGDVVPESIFAFREWMAEHKGTEKYAKSISEHIGSIVRRAMPGNLPHGLCDRSIVFNAAQLETIANVLEHQYFPAKMRITDSKTEHQYEVSLTRFGKYLGRPARLADLNDETVGGWMRSMKREGIAVATINGYFAKVRAFWEWAARRQMVDEFTTLERIPEPERVPSAWTREELGRLFKACEGMQGDVCGVPAAGWWYALHRVAWDTGERLNALLSIRWEWIEGRSLSIPAEVRKGGRKSMVYQLKAPTLDALDAIRQPTREVVFPWGLHITSFSGYYKKLLKLAELPYVPHKSGLHKLRRTFATHIAAAGGEATDALGHADGKTARKSYIDPRISQTAAANAVLFDPAIESDDSIAMEWL